MNFKDFEIRRAGEEKYRFELIKWQVDTFTHNRYCFAVGFLTYDTDDGTFGFESVGLRYMEHYQEGLNDFILRWCELEELIIEAEENDDDKF